MHVYKDNVLSENVKVLTESDGTILEIEHICPKEISEQEAKVRDYREGYQRGYVAALGTLRKQFT